MESFDAKIVKLSIHFIGNKITEGELILSNGPIALENPDLENLLWQYFIDPFKLPEYFAFNTEEIEDSNNVIYQSVSTIFDDVSQLHEQSSLIARHLFDVTSSAQIKEGELFVAYIQNLVLDDELIDGVGIFKSENKEFYLQPESKSDNFGLNYRKGININKLDKGCIIYNTEKSSGFKMRILDNSKTQSNSRYWTTDFLNTVALSDEYHHTDHYLKLTKKFVTNRLNEEEEITKTDQIGFLNKSMEYFKENDSFDGDNFAQTVFDNPKQVAAFGDFKTAYETKKNVELQNEFDISDAAVKKNQRVYKSVLKLDKNFHVYIHGDRSRIERGKEDDGRKYYKIYYTEES